MQTTEILAVLSEPDAQPATRAEWVIAYQLSRIADCLEKMPIDDAATIAAAIDRQQTFRREK